jgi:hypothetical protein
MGQKSFLMGSYEGRIAIENIQNDNTFVKSNKFSFKCHREEAESFVIAHAVTSLAYLKRYT